MSNEVVHWTEARLLVLRGIAEEAGRAILDIDARYAREGEVQTAHKPDASPLTEADLAADRVIRERLAALFPGAAMLSEESDPGADRIDPAKVLLRPAAGSHRPPSCRTR